MRKTIATLLTITTLLVMGGWADPDYQNEKADFSLIEYLETHEINNYSDFSEIIDSVSPYASYENTIDPDSVTYFNIEIDYDDRTVSVLTMEESSGRTTAYNEASKNYYNDSGVKIFTITVSGTFSYSSGSCSAVSCSGNYSKPFYSTWNSTPTITSGNISTKKAYVKIYGTARSGNNSKSYSLTLTCDDSGSFDSY